MTGEAWVPVRDQFGGDAEGLHNSVEEELGNCRGPQLSLPHMTGHQPGVLGESVNTSKDSIVTIAGWEVGDEVHAPGLEPPLWYRKGLKQSWRCLRTVLLLLANGTGLHKSLTC